jgi:hypothetical protein
MKKLSYFLVVMAIAVSSCKKESKNEGSTAISQDQMSECSASAMSVSLEIQNFMLSGYTEAILSGKDLSLPPDPPDTTSLKSALKNTAGFEWSGPDAGGWYTRSTDGYYTYTESFKYVDSTVWYRISIEASDAGSSYSSVWTTHYTRYHKGGKVLYLGASEWVVETFGEVISNTQWDFDFTDWNPNTGAGVYDWYWSASSSGTDPVFYHRFLNIIATEIPFSDPPMLNEKITWYDEGGVEVGSWEFETFQVSVDMPAVPYLPEK